MICEKCGGRLYCQTSHQAGFCAMTRADKCSTCGQRYVTVVLARPYDGKQGNGAYATAQKLKREQAKNGADAAEATPTPRATA